MKILVIGSDGQLGQDIINVLKENNEDFYAATKEDADVTKPEEVNKLFDKVKPSIIINCAAFHDVNECEANPALAMEVNAIAVANLAKKSKEIGAKFITISTDYVFDGKKVKGYTEEDKPFPLMWYGRSKLAGEWLAIANNDHTFVVRTQSLYGLNPPKGKATNFIDLMIKLSKERDELKVDQYLMSPTWAYPLAKNIYNLSKTEHYGLYHISCQGAVTWYEVAKKIMELTKNPVKVTAVGNDFFPKKFNRPNNTYLINKKLKKLKLDTMPTWEEALSEYLKQKGLLK